MGREPFGSGPVTIVMVLSGRSRVGAARGRPDLRGRGGPFCSRCREGAGET